MQSMTGLVEKFFGKPRPEPKFSAGRFFSDEKLLGQHFQGESWRPWVAIVKALRGEELTDDELTIFQRLTARENAPAVPVEEFYAAAGRGSGKSRVDSAMAVYLAVSFHWPSVLSRGERGVVMLLACDRTQARILMNYIIAFIDDSPLLSSLVVGRTSGRVELSNQVDIEVHTSNYKSVRGRSIIACLCDELSFWKDETSACPDTEVLRAVRPGLARVPGSMLLCFSSPYRRHGELWRAHQRYFGKENRRVLFLKAATRELNPTLPQQVIDDAMEDDAIAARSEWLAEFRDDVSSFLSEEEIANAVRGEDVLPPRELLEGGPLSYMAAVDMSGGRKDRFALSIAHREGDRVIIDGVWHWPARMSVESVVDEIAAILSQYRVASVTGDKYGSELTRSIYRAKSIEYRWNELSTSDIYLEVRTLFSVGRIEIPDNPILLNELRGLERRPGMGGKDKVDHGPGAHDDVAAACCMVAFDSWKRGSLDGWLAEGIPSQVSQIYDGGLTDDAYDGGLVH